MSSPRQDTSSDGGAPGGGLPASHHYSKKRQAAAYKAFFETMPYSPPKPDRIYRRLAFGDAWDDNNDAPGGHNGCDTRDDILNRDLVDKTYVSIKRCPDAVATGTLHDPYTNLTIAFQRGAQIGESVQIDHIVRQNHSERFVTHQIPCHQHGVAQPHRLLLTDISDSSKV